MTHVIPGAVQHLLSKLLLPLALKVKEPLSFLSESEQYSSHTSLMFGLRASAMASAVNWIKEKLHSSLHFNSVPLALIIRDRLWDSSRDLFSNSLWVLRKLFVLSRYFSCRKDVSDALLHYWIDGRYVCQSFDLISDLPFNQILKFPGRLL